MTTGKTIALTRWTFVGKVMSLLFNMLSRLVVTFLPRNKHLLISWLQSPSAVSLEPPKIKPEFELLHCQRRSIYLQGSVPHAQWLTLLVWQSNRQTQASVTRLLNSFIFILEEHWVYMRNVCRAWIMFPLETQQLTQMASQPALYWSILFVPLNYSRGVNWGAAVINFNGNLKSGSFSVIAGPRPKEPAEAFNLRHFPRRTIRITRNVFWRYIIMKTSITLPFKEPQL